MFCVIQEVELKKPNKHGYPKELKSYFVNMSFNGSDMSHYCHSYSFERFERPIKRAYKITIHNSYRENGKVKKKQYPLCTMNYYELADSCPSLYDLCNRKITAVASEMGVSEEVIYNLVYAKLDPLTETIKNEFSFTVEFKTNEEHEHITTLYAINKMKFTEQYGCDKDKYDQVYDVFGNLMNKSKLDEVEAEFEYRQEYEEKSRSYQKQSYSNHNNYYSGGSSSYSNGIHSNHSTEDKETLKQFYRELSKKFHPDSNPDTDTSKQMQLLNQLKDQWGV